MAYAGENSYICPQKTNLLMISKTFTTPRELIIDAIQDRKGRSITVVELDNIPGASASTFIIAEGNSTTQVSSIADHLEERLLTDARMKPYNTDGFKNSEWIVLDYGDIWVHIFLPEVRRRYNLEELWSDADITEIPDLD